jgi:hypothetical protein
MRGGSVANVADWVGTLTRPGVHTYNPVSPASLHFLSSCVAFVLFQPAFHVACPRLPRYTAQVYILNVYVVKLLEFVVDFPTEIPTTHQIYRVRSMLRILRIHTQRDSTGIGTLSWHQRAVIAPRTHFRCRLINYAHTRFEFRAEPHGSDKFLDSPSRQEGK